MKVLIVPDVPGWAVDSMADGIISALSDKFIFTKRYADNIAKDMGFPIIDWKVDYDKYDKIYIMLPGYIDNIIAGDYDMKKICTTFHGGPGTEGQADQLDRQKLNDLNISFVSYQTKKRVCDVTNNINRKMNIRLKEVVDIDWLKHELGFGDGEDKIVRFEGEERYLKRLTKNKVNVVYRRKGYNLRNLSFTPHGVNIKRFKQDSIIGEPVFGYAGWARYILGAQKEHRQCDWIFNSWRNNPYKLKVAGGTKKYDAKGDLTKLKYLFNMDKLVDISYYEHNDVHNFYKSISCYLVPDKYAGGPMPVLEAGAMNIPVICTDAGLCGDIIEDGINGIKISTFKEFENAIDFMKNNKNEREKMGKKLGELVRETRSWDAVSKYWEDFFLK